MLIGFLLFSYVFSAQYLTNFNNAFSFVENSDTVYVATAGGVVSFVPSTISHFYSNFSFSYRVFTTANGLRSNYVLDIDEDGVGNLWVIVRDVGIQVKRKDSDRFEAYDLPIVTLRKAKIIRYFGDDYFLIGTDYGLFVLKTGGNINSEDDRIYPPLIIRDSVKFIERGKDFAYIVTPLNIYGWTPDSTFRIDVPLNYGRFRIVKELADGILYSTGTKLVFASAETTLIFDAGSIYAAVKDDNRVYIGSNWGTYLFENRRLTKILSYPSSCIIPIEDSGIIFTYFSTNREFSYYGPPWRYFDGSTIYSFSTPVLFNLVTSLKFKGGVLASGILAWTSDSISLPSKLLIFDGQELRYGEGLRNIDHAIRSVDIDDSGKIWVGLYSANSPGIYIYDSSGRLQHIVDNLPSRIVCHISIAKDTLVALWQDGIYRIHRDGSFFTAERVFMVDYPFFVEQSGNDRYLIGTENEGLIIIDTSGNLVLRLNPSDLNSALVSVAKSKGEKIYIGTSNGLLVYRGMSIKKISTGYVRDIEFYKNFVIALTDSAIQLIYDDSLVYSFTSMNSPFTPINEQYYRVRDVLEIMDDGTLVVGGQEGILLMKVLFPDLKKESFRVFPNPARVGERIYVDAPEEPVVYDLSMRRLPYRAKLDGDLYFFDTNGWARGIYIIFSGDRKPVKILLR
uniref:Two component regulator three Y domain-containing protein n=1 Tax=candidate division WOR-3 bacterium TaxID=2052148 RepID=A0A7C2K351_UNCW3